MAGTGAAEMGHRRVRAVEGRGQIDGKRAVPRSGVERVERLPVEARCQERDDVEAPQRGGGTIDEIPARGGVREIGLEAPRRPAASTALTASSASRRER